MKFLVFLLVVSTCLMATKANIVLSSEELDDIEFVANDVSKACIVDAEPYLLSWATLNIVIRKALAIILGVKCTVREVLEIKAAAEKFVNDVQKCGLDASDTVKSLLATCKNIISLCNDILHVNENVCGYSTEPEESDEAETPRRCFKKLYKKTVELKDEVKKAIDLIEKIKNLEAGKCAIAAVKNLESVLIKFPVKIEFCSKLLHA